MNSVCKHILNKKIDSIEFSAGIGIDYGKMLITKSGVIRHGDEKEFYRSLVWLGQPANTASRLTDLANKKGSYSIQGLSQGIHYPLTNVWSWIDCTFEQFVSALEITYTRNLSHKNEYFKTYILKDLGPYTYNNSPILMTKAVYDGFKKERPNADSIKNEWWSKQSLDVRDYVGDIYGGDVVLKVVEEI